VAQGSKRVRPVTCVLCVLVHNLTTRAYGQSQVALKLCDNSQLPEHATTWARWTKNYSPLRCTVYIVWHIAGVLSVCIAWRCKLLHA
jgi:hypothetical protein